MQNKLQEAITAHQKGRYDDAEMLYTEILQQTPDNAHVLYLMGVLMLAQHDYASSKTFLTKAIYNEPKKASYHCALAHVHDHLYDYASAKQSYLNAITIDGNYYEALSNLGKVYVNMGDFDSANTMLKRAFDLEPKNPESHVGLARLFLATDRQDWGRSACFTALELDPDYYEANIVLGKAWMSANVLDRAENRFRHALKIEPNNPEAHTLLGNLFITHANYTWAEAAFKTALEKRPSYRDAHIGLAQASAQLGKLRESSDCWRQVFYLSSHDTTHYLQMAKAYLKVSEIHWATALIKELLTKEPNNTDALELSAVLNHYMGAHDESSSQMRKAMLERILSKNT